jgi:cytochrome c556
MDVQSCIDAYCELSKTVFQDENLLGKMGRLSGRVIKASRGKPWFEAAKLESAVKTIIKKQLGDANAALFPSNASGKASKV